MRIFGPMKNLYLIASVLFISMTIAGCGSKSALDINVAELDTACDFVDALDQVATEMMEITGDGDISTDEEEKFEKLVKKVEEVSDAAESKHDVSEAKKCPNWDTLQEKVDELEDYM